MPTLVFLALLITGVLLRPQQAAPCLRYGSGEVTIQGELSRRTFPGPPNYESVAAGDSAETAILVTLASPVCVTPDSASASPDDVFENDVHEIQLAVAADSVWRQLGQVRGQRVAVTGTLFHAISGHHHTRVLLWATRVRAV